jgi:OOP family OmpA-OmpF porin
VRTLMASVAAMPLLLGSVPAFAQNNPSAEQIIRSLKPGGDLGGSTRGIRLAAPDSNPSAPPQQAKPAPTTPGSPRVASSKPGPAPAARPAAGSTTGQPAVSLTVNFANDSAELTAPAMRTLNELGRALASNELSGYRFRIEGHTDTVGQREYNRALSERRAAAVVDYIVKTFGVDASRLQAVGMGQDGLLIATPPQTPEPRNRRVEVVNLGT